MTDGPRDRPNPGGFHHSSESGGSQQLYSVHDWGPQHGGSGFLPASHEYSPVPQPYVPGYASFADGAPHRPGALEQQAPPPPPPRAEQLFDQQRHGLAPYPTTSYAGYQYHPQHHPQYTPNPQQPRLPRPRSSLSNANLTVHAAAANANAGPYGPAGGLPGSAQGYYSPEAPTHYSHGGGSYPPSPLFASPVDVHQPYAAAQPSLLDGLVTTSASAYQLHYPSHSPSIHSLGEPSPSPTSSHSPEPNHVPTPTGLTRVRSFSHPITPVSPTSSTSTPDSNYSSRTFRSDPTAALSVSSAAQAAALHRTLLKTATPAPSLKKVVKRDTSGAPPKKKGTKLSIEQPCACRVCGVQFAVATLRGTEQDLDVPYSAQYSCMECSPKAPVPRGRDGAPILPDPEGSDDFGAKYQDTLSAAVDRLEGLDLNHDPRPPPSTKVSTAGRKRRAQEQELVSCDVCARDVGTGNLIPKDSRSNLTFGVEILCTSCGDKYRRCSDCGGGGGVRVGVGKWRCKELFPEARKTCQISHLRLGAIHDMSYSIWPINEIPPQDIDTLIMLCRDLWTSTILATLATPETLEAAAALARTYDEINKLATDSWTLCEPYIREDIEEAQSLRRYIALRWSVPAPRKRGKAASVKSPTAPAEEPGGPLIRTDGKQLAGFILGELDFQAGSLFLPFTMPTGTGETFESTTILLQTLHARIKVDMRAANDARRQLGQPEYPKLTEAWTMRMYKKETRILTRRGYHSLADFLKGWGTYVKRLEEDDDWGHSRAAGRSGSKASDDY
ncbi:hypothetical protein RQP46_002379 [Phenoliferia psychrophenolica]